MLPLILLDVDGVLNAFDWQADASSDSWSHGFARAQGQLWPITFSPAVVDALRAWHEAGQGGDAVADDLGTCRQRESARAARPPAPHGGRDLRRRADDGVAAGEVIPDELVDDVPDPGGELRRP